jgi:hypothetical protein
MAIVQISRITNRKGLIENLPQLAGGELGWAVDSRKLFIGNGTVEEGAPAIGNTEILTEYSTDLISLLLTNIGQLRLGSWTRVAGATAEIGDNLTDEPLFTFDIADAPAFKVDYMLTRENSIGQTTVRTGTFSVAASPDGSGVGIVYSDDALANAAAGVTLTATESAGVITVRYSSTNTGYTGTINYSITYLG